MTGFIVRRVLSSILVVILTSMFVFVLFFKGLGDSPARNYCEKLGPGKCIDGEARLHQAPDGLRQVPGLQLRHLGEGHLRRPSTTSTSTASTTTARPRAWASRITTGDTVWNDLKQKYPATITLAVGGAAIYLVLGVRPRRPGRAMAWHSGRPVTGRRHAGRLVDPLLRDRPAGVDLSVPPAQDLPRAPGTTRSPRTPPRRSPGWPCRGW